MFTSDMLIFAYIRTTTHDHSDVDGEFEKTNQHEISGSIDRCCSFLVRERARADEEKVANKRKG